MGGHPPAGLVLQEGWVFLLEHIAARRPWHDDFEPGHDPLTQHAHVDPGRFEGGLQVTAVQGWHATAARILHCHLDPILRQHLDRCLPYSHVIIVYRTRWEEDDFSLWRITGRNLPRPLTPEPAIERLGGVIRKWPIAVNAEHRLHQAAVPSRPVEPVQQWGGQAGKPTDEIGPSQNPILQGDTFPLGPHHLLPKHQPWEIDRPAMGRCIGTMVVAEFALVTLLTYNLQIALSKLFSLPVHALVVKPLE